MATLALGKANGHSGTVDPVPFFGMSHRSGRIVALLDVDPDFGRGLSAEDRRAAHRHLPVALEDVPRGLWLPRVHRHPPVAYVVVSGTLLRGARVEQRCATELLGPEDVMRPWDEDESPAGLAYTEGWTVLEPVRLAVLDRRFATAAARWPALLDELLRRSLQRARRLMTLMSVSGIRRLDLRLLVLLRILADRWGKVSPDGIRLELRLTHETLARLAGAQRPSVSTALGRLQHDGLLTMEHRTFVLPAEFPEPVTRELKRRPAA
jgi:CRP/FNR family transcriptional regulator, cyclic AMP receptor protein